MGDRKSQDKCECCDNVATEECDYAIHTPWGDLAAHVCRECYDKGTDWISDHSPQNKHYEEIGQKMAAEDKKRNDEYREFLKTVGDTQEKRRAIAKAYAEGKYKDRIFNKEGE